MNQKTTDAPRAAGYHPVQVRHWKRSLEVGSEVAIFKPHSYMLELRPISQDFKHTYAQTNLTAAQRCQYH